MHLDYETFLSWKRTVIHSGGTLKITQKKSPVSMSVLEREFTPITSSVARFQAAQQSS